MAIGIPRLLGEVHDKDTQFTAAMKQNQELVLLGLCVAVIAIGFLIYSFMPDTRQGTWRYGICKIFLERFSQYPEDLKILTVAEKQNSAQIGYLTTNSYGSQQSELMECFYNLNQKGVSINRVTINRKPLVFAPDSTGTKDTSDIVLDANGFAQVFENGRRDMANIKYSTVTLDEFNKTIGSIMAADDLDLTIPPRLPNTLKDLKFN